jgi:hypothetical protein
VGLRLAAFLPASPRVFPDSGTYVKYSRQSLFTQAFWAGPRPPTVPLLYKLLPDSDSWRTGAQLACSIVAWLALAAAVAWCVARPWVRLAGFAVVLAFSCSVWVTQWDAAVLSESLSISLSAAVLAAWLVYVRAPGWWSAGAVLAATLAWVLVRDSSVVVVAGAAGATALALVLPGDRRVRGALAAGLVLACAVSLWSAGKSWDPQGRWEQPMRNVIGVRVLTAAGELDWFRDRGMPVTPLLLSHAGEPVGSLLLRSGKPGSEDPRLVPFRRWVRAHARETLATYLLTHPRRALEPAVRDRAVLFEPDPKGRIEGGGPARYYRPSGLTRVVPGIAEDVLYPPRAWELAAWALLALAVAAFLAWRGRARAAWLVPLVALVLQVPHAALVWHGDTEEIPRHAVVVGVMTHTALLVLTVFLLDAAARVESRGRGGAQPHHGPGGPRRSERP